MRPIALVPLALAVLVALVSPVPSSAHSHAGVHAYSYGYQRGHQADDDFGWAVVSGGDAHTSDLDDTDILERLKDRYDGDFLYVRDGKEHYVIRDPRLVARADQSCDEIRKYGKEIGQLARAQAKLALAGLQFSGQRRSLERAARELEREIARNERHGDSTEGLERALRHIRDEIEDLPDEDHATSGMTAKERADLERQSRDAQEHLQGAVKKMRQDIRDILREAKEKGKAEKIDAKDLKSF